MPTVLISPEPLRHQPGRFREVFSEAGFTCLDLPPGPTATEAQLRETLPKVDAMLAGSERLTGELFDLAPRLRAIARTGVGYDAVDVPAASARRIPVIITPGTNQESVAEQMFSLLLGLTRNLVNNDRLVRDGGWTRALVQPIRGKTLGLVGLGRIGRAVATRALAFGMSVIAYDPVADPETDARLGISRRSLDELLAESDVVSLHLPLVPETRGMVNRAFLARMRPESYLINTSRGGLVVEADLAQSLVSGHLAGAGLDVFQSEPPEPGNPLVHLPNVVMSPHLGGIDAKSMSDMGELAARCIIMLYEGKWPDGCVVNQQLATGWRW
jgi:phosphoglycerate dehydrogenase-like enzyme